MSKVALITGITGVGTIKDLLVSGAAGFSSSVTRDGPFGAGDNTRGVLGGSAGGPSNMGGPAGKGVCDVTFIRAWGGV